MGFPKLMGIFIVLNLGLMGLSCLAAEAAPANDDGGKAGPYSPWWNYGWTYRMPITIKNNKPNAALPSQYTVSLSPSLGTLMAAGKVLSDGRDARVVWFNSTSGKNLPLDRLLDLNNNNMLFRTQQSIPAGGSDPNYFLYYGNRNTGNPPQQKSNIYALYDDFNDNTLNGNLWTEDSPSPGMMDTGEGHARLEQTGTVWYTASNTYLKTQQSFQDFELSVDFDQVGGSGTGAWEDQWSGIMFRTTSWARENSGQYNFNGMAYEARISRSGNAVSLMRFGNSYNPVTIQDSSQAIARTTVYNLKIRAVDNSMTLLWNNNSIVSRTDSSIAGAGPIVLRARVGDGWGQGSIYNAWDNLRVRKYVLPEPSATLGDEQMPVTLKSTVFSPKEPSVNDTVLVNSTFSNRAPVQNTIDVSFWIGDDFNSSAKLMERKVLVAASGEAKASLTWRAQGGAQTIWTAISGHQVGNVVINVNRPPVLDRIRDQSAPQGEPKKLTLAASDPDGDALSWSTNSSMFGIAPTGNRTAEISFSPTNDDVGVHLVEISVSDTHARSASQSVMFTVDNINDPPSIEDIPDLAATEHKGFHYRVNATDPDLKWGDSLTFSDETDLFDINEVTGYFSFTPTEAQVGRHSVKLTVTDNEGASASATFILTVANTNEPPVLGPVPPQTALQGKWFQLNVDATDPDIASDRNEQLRFSDDSPLFVIDPLTGVIRFIPSNNDVGKHRINITVTDRAGANRTTGFILTVVNINDPPVLEQIADQTAIEDKPFSLAVNATDPDLKPGLDNLTFWDDSPLFKIGLRTGRISFVPTNAMVGEHRVNITVKDRFNATGTVSFVLDVKNVNDPPMNVSISSIRSGQKCREGTTIWLNGTGRDIDPGDELEFSWRDNDILIGTGKSMTLKLTRGEHLILLSVSDGTRTIWANASIEVTEKPKPASNENLWYQRALFLAGFCLFVAIATAVAVKWRRTGAPSWSDFSEEPPYAPGASVAALSVEQASAGGIAPAGQVMVPVPAAPVPGIPSEALRQRDEARTLITSLEKAIADYIEQNAERAKDTSFALENIEIARQFLEEGEYDGALRFGRLAETAVLEMAAAGRPAAAEEKETAPAARTCPKCGEALEAGWIGCPVCGVEHAPVEVPGASSPVMQAPEVPAPVTVPEGSLAPPARVPEALPVAPLPAGSQAPPAAIPVPSVEGPQARDEARRLIVASEGALAEYLEQNPDDVAKAEPLMEKLDIARQMLDDGEYEMALRYAKEAEAAARELKPVETPPQGMTDAAPVCPKCGSPLEAGWVACPECGHRL